jgi:hypothetical protein
MSSTRSAFGWVLWTALSSNGVSQVVGVVSEDEDGKAVPVSSVSVVTSGMGLVGYQLDLPPVPVYHHSTCFGPSGKQFVFGSLENASFFSRTMSRR